jgi:hypothetical protein
MGAAELEDYLELQDPKIREHIRKKQCRLPSRPESPSEELSGRASRGDADC